MSVESFPRSVRLLHPRQFTRVFQQGKFLQRHGAIRIRVLDDQQPHARLGVIVPKKGNPLAVRRNRIKRIIRDHFRLAQTRLQSLDIIVHVTAPVTDAELHRSLQRCFDRLTPADTQETI